jgi:hypothetical protein
VGVVLGGLDGFLPGLGRDALALFGLISGSGFNNAGSGFGLATAGYAWRVSSASGREVDRFGNWGGGGGWGWGGAGSGAGLFDDEGGLGDGEVLLRERSLRLFFLLQSQDKITCLNMRSDGITNQNQMSNNLRK